MILLQDLFKFPPWESFYLKAYAGEFWLIILWKSKKKKPKKSPNLTQVKHEIPLNDFS
jgi:hypothetical protein